MSWVFFYYGKVFSSAAFSTRVAEVHCDKCGCKYYYKLTRIGTGSATAHYGIGKDASRDSAAVRSRADLAERLANEAELVPCPKCNWINEGLIRGYRRERLRHRGGWALGVASVAAALMMIGAWIAASHNPAEFGLAIRIALGARAAYSTGGALLFHARGIWIRCGVRPNRDFPLPPKLPPGSPPAWTMDEETGDMRVAGPPRDQYGGDWQVYQMGRDRLPPICCDCLKAVAPESVQLRHVAIGVAVAVPRCVSCQARSQRKLWLVSVGLAAIAILITAGALAALRLEWEALWLSLIVSTTVSALLSVCVAHVATTPIRVRFADRSRGVVIFRFRNPKYEERIPVVF